MKISKSKTKATLISLLLVLTIAVSLFSTILLTAKAQVIQPVVTVPNWIYVSAAPNPVGVGQPMTIVYWGRHMPPSTLQDPSLGAPGGRECWTGVTITITDPDQTKETISLPPSDPVGSGWYTFVPDKLGNYTIQAHFPGQWKNSSSIPPWGSTNYFPMPGSYYFVAADSPEATFEVTQEPLQWLSGTPLPTEYWTRPINAYNREWFQIAGNWITGNRDDPYITAPNSAHVVLTEPYFFGGIAGGAHEALDYYEGTSYEGKFGGVTIMSGMLFYNLNLGSSSTTSQQTIVAKICERAHCFGRKMALAYRHQLYISMSLKTNMAYTLTCGLAAIRQ